MQTELAKIFRVFCFVFKSPILCCMCCLQDWMKLELTFFTA
jgi:hypothetical protein